MPALGRLLKAVTLRRVFVFLLLAGFAQQLLASLGWLAGTGGALGEVSAVRALLLATLNLALEATLVYLAARGLASLLGRRRRPRDGSPSGPAVRRTGFSASPAEVLDVDAPAPARPGEGGDDGRGPDYR